MKFRTLIPALALAAILSPAARAAGDSLLSLEVLVDGIPLNELAARGTTYVEAVRGRPYSLRITNRQGCRVAVAVAVDGLNVVDAKRSSALDARKWILEPWESLVLDGWQTSGRDASRFVFTSEPRSYAAWLGDASNSGLIEAVAFRELPPRPVAHVERPSHGGWWGSDRDEARRQDAPAAEQQSSRAEGMPSAPSAAGAAKSRQDERLSEDSAATGFGERVDHEVVTVQFEHERTPCSRARVRYEYRDALVRLGIVPAPRPCPDPLQRRESARGFTDGPWCPPPPRCR